MNKSYWTLTEIARLLRQPQHRLIYLCEKGVIRPEFSDAHGRGSSRRFSDKNIFEFSIALILSEFHFPATTVANIIYAVQSFELSVKHTGIDDFSLPSSLIAEASPEIIGIITSGSMLYFSLGYPGRLKKVFGGVDISQTAAAYDLPLTKIQQISDLYKSADRDDSFTGSNVARFEINLNLIAQNLNI